MIYVQRPFRASQGLSPQRRTPYCVDRSRCITAADPMEAYRHKMQYANSVTLHRKCLNIAEAKGLVGTPDKQQFVSLLKALPQIGIEILEIKRHGKIHIYETKDFA